MLAVFFGYDLPLVAIQLILVKGRSEPSIYTQNPNLQIHTGLTGVTHRSDRCDQTEGTPSADVHTEIPSQGPRKFRRSLDR